VFCLVLYGGCGHSCMYYMHASKYRVMHLKTSLTLLLSLILMVSCVVDIFSSVCWLVYLCCKFVNFDIFVTVMSKRDI